MIQRLRSIIAFFVAAILVLITLNRVELDRTGRSTASGSDDSASTRETVTRRIDRS